MSSRAMEAAAKRRQGTHPDLKAHPQERVPGGSGQVSELRLRPFPYPFRAGLAICSDIDGTTSLDRFLSIQQFLNTSWNTSLGPGLGLEIGNSFFPYTPDDSFAYFSTRPDDRRAIEALIQSGHIDCLHSFGDGATTRADAQRALEALQSKDCRLQVWVDHSRAPSNLGKDTTPGTGDMPTSPIYHADLTLEYGIRYVWKGRGSSIVGHGVPLSRASLESILDRAHLGRTFVNLMNELAKITLARAGSRRFAIHRANQLLRPTRLLDGQAIYEFNRCNNHWRGLSYGHDSQGLAYVLREAALRNLLSNQGWMVVYTHLGVGPERPPYLPPACQESLRNLADKHRQGLIYVTTTARLLHAHRINRCLDWSHSIAPGGEVHIRISGCNDPVFGSQILSETELQGVTFYVPESDRAKIFLGDREIVSIARNPCDHLGKQSVTIPLRPLEYPLPPWQGQRP